MKLEDQVCSLELAKRLKELCIKQESSFYWYKGYDSWLLHYVDYNHHQEDSKIFKDRCSHCYSAFTVGELFELLPACIDSKMNEPFNYFWLHIKKRSVENIQYIAHYLCDTINGMDINNPAFQLNYIAKSYDSKLSDCLAKMLIHLIENKLMDLP